MPVILSIATSGAEDLLCGFGIFLAAEVRMLGMTMWDKLPSFDADCHLLDGVAHRLARLGRADDKHPDGGRHGIRLAHMCYAT